MEILHENKDSNFVRGYTQGLKHSKKSIDLYYDKTIDEKIPYTLVEAKYNFLVLIEPIGGGLANIYFLTRDEFNQKKKIFEKKIEENRSKKFNDDDYSSLR